MGFDKREDGTEVMFLSDYDAANPSIPKPSIKDGDFAHLNYQGHPVIVKIQTIDNDKFIGTVENEPYPYFNHQEEVIFWEDEIRSVEKQ